jgi:hypothetical protein
LRRELPHHSIIIHLVEKNKEIMADLKVRSSYRAIAILIIILIVLGGGLGYYRTLQQKAAVPAKTFISQEQLAEEYGIQINLVAVTAAGGMVDVRLKFIDAEKAKTILQAKENFPALYVSEVNRTLLAPEDDQKQEILFEDNANMFLLFPNAANAVKQGTEVNLMFGDLAVEAIAAQ